MRITAAVYRIRSLGGHGQEYMTLHGVKEGETVRGLLERLQITTERVELYSITRDGEEALA